MHSVLQPCRYRAAARENEGAICRPQCCFVQSRTPELQSVCLPSRALNSRSAQTERLRWCVRAPLPDVASACAAGATAPNHSGCSILFCFLLLPLLLTVKFVIRPVFSVRFARTCTQFGKEGCTCSICMRDVDRKKCRKGGDRTKRRPVGNPQPQPPSPPFESHDYLRATTIREPRQLFSLPRPVLRGMRDFQKKHLCHEFLPV